MPPHAQRCSDTNIRLQNHCFRIAHPRHRRGLLVRAVFAHVLHPPMRSSIHRCRIRSLRRKQRAIANVRRPSRSRRSSSLSQHEQMSHRSHSLFVHDSVLLESGDFAVPLVLPNSPSLAYHPDSARSRRVTRAFDTDEHGRRVGSHPDDLTGKEDLPAYSLPIHGGQPLPPSYIELHAPDISPPNSPSFRAFPPPDLAVHSPDVQDSPSL